MKNMMNQAIIFYWMMLNPVKLFQRINALDWYQNTLRAWVDDLVVPNKGNILEVGCASGVLTEYLAASGFNATGIDASDKMIQAALGNKNHRGHFQTADAKSLPFRDLCFDSVISASLLNIVSEPENVLREMSRVCKPGGTVSVLVPRTGVSESQIVQLIHTHCTTAFSQAVLSTWHKRAPKLQAHDVMGLFKLSGLISIRQKDYLGGMVTTVSGVKLY
jgi:ubiquinone/menaquinone biosynthesis C-methylase UbiE